jgi:hypothetical protein
MSNVLIIFSIDKLGVIAQVCDPHLFNTQNLTTENTENINIVQSLREMSVPQTEQFLACKWRNKIFNCTSFMTEILTEEG